MDNQTLLWKADDNQIRENQLFEEHLDALEPLELSSPAPGLPFNFETTLQWKWRLYNLHKTRNGPRRGSQRAEEKKRRVQKRRLDVTNHPSTNQRRVFFVNAVRRIKIEYLIGLGFLQLV